MEERDYLNIDNLFKSEEAGQPPENCKPNQFEKIYHSDSDDDQGLGSAGKSFFSLAEIERPIPL